MNWANPLITTQYDVFLAEVKSRDVDSFTMGAAGYLTIANPPTGAMVFQREGYFRFLEYTGSAWGTRLIGIPGGGTGADNPAGARANLEIGTMGVQYSNAVNITGGTIWGITQLDLNTPIHFIQDGVFDIGSPSGAVRHLYVRHGLVVPVGLNKYVP